MKSYVGWVVAAIILLAWYFWPTPTVVQSDGKIDTVFVEKVLPRDTIMIPSAPQVVRIYLLDTAARAKAEKGDIITAVNFESHKITVDKLSPRGVGIRQEYHLPELAAVRIDGSGQAEIKVDRKAKRKSFLRKAGIVAAGAGLFVLGLVL